MNPAHLPTEAQCLAMRMCATADILVKHIAKLPFLAGEQAAQGAPIAADLAGVRDQLLMLARLLRFDADRMEKLIDDQVEADRVLHALTEELVDACRIAGGTAQVQTALADMQALLAERFPGEADI